MNDGRVIVFVLADIPDRELVEVYAVPGHWGEEDIATYIDGRHDWVTASLTTVREVEA
jgi:hypothetical protein